MCNKAPCRPNVQSGVNCAVRKTTSKDLQRNGPEIDPVVTGCCGQLSLVLRDLSRTTKVHRESHSLYRAEAEMVQTGKIC